MAGQLSLPKIGLIVTDALRVMGIRSILRDREDLDLVSVTGPEDDICAALSLILIDSSATDDLFTQLSRFREKQPRIRLLILGDETSLEHIEQVIRAGGKGYLTHAAGEQELRRALREIMDGYHWAPRRVLSRLLERTLRNEGEESEVSFTKRELEVLGLLVLGQPNRQIAASLGVDEGTIKAHLSRLMRKARVDNRTALSMRALERNWAARPK